MTDERRAASMPEGADPDGPTLELPAHELPTDSDPSGDSLASPEPVHAEGPVTQARRARMALRIPDDEIARPERPVEQLEKETASVEPLSEPMPASAPIVPGRIITINPPAAPAAAEAVAVSIPQAPAPLPSAPVVDEEGWSADDDRPTPIPVRSVSARPTAARPPPEPTPEPGVAPEAEDGEDVRFEEETPTPALPAVVAELDLDPDIDQGRKSEPGDAPEVSPEDLVAVESVPARPSVKPVPPPKKTPPKPPLVIVPPHVGALVAQPVDSPGSRRKGRLWWEDFFNDDYVRTMEKITDTQIGREVRFIEDSLGVERGGAVLDLGCGTGRHAVELATRGYEVVGFDLSLAMLSRAGDEAQERGVKLNFVQGDMREMAFEEQFDGIFCWNTTFGYFEEEKNNQVVAKVHRALKTGGMFLLDVVNRDFLVRQSPTLAWFEGDGCVCMDDMAVDFITSRMRVKRTMMFDDGRTREVEYSIRVYGLHELGKILHDSGFKVCEVSGRLATPGVFFGNESPRTLILAEKR